MIVAEILWLDVDLLKVSLCYLVLGYLKTHWPALSGFNFLLLMIILVFV